MPEKPEVVTVARKLREQVLHKTITKCNVYWDNIIAEPSVSSFQKNIVGEEILDITTRGKFILFSLTHYLLLIHLRMEGKFFFREVGEKIEKHEHVEFILDDSLSFRYHDVRKFGKMYLLPKEDAFSMKPLKDLGYEYDDVNLNGIILKDQFSHKNLPIKSVLLDQSIICGIGNIYDDEILFLSHIHPLTKASHLSLKNCEDIVFYTREVLDHAIQLGGTTIRSFTSSEGVHGLFQNELLVHGQSECKKCGSKILKIVVGGRGTYFCEKCQKMKK